MPTSPLQLLSQAEGTLWHYIQKAPEPSTVAEARELGPRVQGGGGGALSAHTPHPHPYSAHLSSHSEQVPRALGLCSPICPMAGMSLAPPHAGVGPGSAEVGLRPLLPLAQLLP